MSYPHDRFVVRTNRRALLRVYTPTMVLLVLATVLITGLAGVLGWLLWNVGSTWAAIGFPSLMAIPQIWALCYYANTYRRRLNIDVVMVVDHVGVRLAVQQTGVPVFLPWEVLAPVKAPLRTLRFRLRPGVDVDHAGITGLEHPRIKRVLRRTGLQVGMVGLEADREEIAGAIRWFSAGRVHVDARVG